MRRAISPPQSAAEPQHLPEEASPKRVKQRALLPPVSRGRWSADSPSASAPGQGDHRKAQEESQDQEPDSSGPRGPRGVQRKDAIKRTSAIGQQSDRRNKKKPPPPPPRAASKSAAFCCPCTAFTTPTAPSISATPPESSSSARPQPGPRAQRGSLRRRAPSPPRQGPSARPTHHTTALRHSDQTCGYLGGVEADGGHAAEGGGEQQRVEGQGAATRGASGEGAREGRDGERGGGRGGGEEGGRGRGDEDEDDVSKGKGKEEDDEEDDEDNDEDDDDYEDEDSFYWSSGAQEEASLCAFSILEAARWCAGLRDPPITAHHDGSDRKLGVTSVMSLKRQLEQRPNWCVFAQSRAASSSSLHRTHAPLVSVDAGAERLTLDEKVEVIATMMLDDSRRRDAKSAEACSTRAEICESAAYTRASRFLSSYEMLRDGFCHFMGCLLSDASKQPKAPSTLSVRSLVCCQTCIKHASSPQDLMYKACWRGALVTRSALESPRRNPIATCCWPSLLAGPSALARSPQSHLACTCDSSPWSRRYALARLTCPIAVTKGLVGGLRRAAHSSTRGPTHVACCVCQNVSLQTVAHQAADELSAWLERTDDLQTVFVVDDTVMNFVYSEEGSVSEGQRRSMNEFVQQQVHETMVDLVRPALFWALREASSLAGRSWAAFT
ncbi:hypothetical protein Efla_006567 [Eimeria flavescens]